MSITSTIRTLAVCGAVAALAACTSLNVRTDINPAMYGATCRSYAFADEHVAGFNGQAAYGNPLNADRLRQAIEGNMAYRGITKVADRKAADCVVGYAMGSRQVIDDYYGTVGVWGGGWRRGGFGWGVGYDGPWVTDETRISIDLFDAKTHTPIWHASVSQDVGDLRGPNAVQKINAATSAIFAKFPVPGVAPYAPRSAT